MLTNFEYVDSNGELCPKCNSENIEWEPDLETDSDCAYQSVWCHDCKFRWMDKYALIGYTFSDDARTDESIVGAPISNDDEKGEYQDRVIIVIGDDVETIMGSSHELIVVEDNALKEFACPICHHDLQDMICPDCNLNWNDYVVDREAFLLALLENPNSVIKYT